MIHRAIHALSKANPSLRYIYISSFLLSFHYALIAYINSSFMGQFLREEAVGILFSISAVLNIILLVYIPRLLRHFGNRFLMLVFVFLEVLAILGMILSKNVYTVVPLFILHQVMISILSLNLDIFLEHYSKRNEVGSTRGIFFTFISLAYVVAQLFVGLVLIEGGLYKIYAISLLIVLPLFFIVKNSFKDFTDLHYKDLEILKTGKQFLIHKDIYDIYLANFFLQFFYAIMVIYTPLYLLRHIGFSYGEMGILFAIMLLPFVLLEGILGKLADKYCGEKELLILGFLVIGLSTMSISFTTTKSLAFFAVALFMTRVGASLVEMMTESYFFKKVKEADANLVSAFRTTRPLSLLIAPLLASGVLSFIDHRYLFLALGIFMLLGLRYACAIKDTK